MATLAPFRGLLFDPVRVPDIHRVVAFPPDPFVQKLTGNDENLSPYHVNRLLEILQRTEPPSEADFKAPFERWRGDGIVIEEPQPALYATEESFKVGERSYKRRTLYALVQTASHGLDPVVPHEKTDPKRLMRFAVMLRAFQANISPIFALYEDQEREVRSTLQALWPQRQMIRSFVFGHSKLSGDLKCTLYRLADGKRVQKLLQLFRRRPLFIADGHHRYEAALHVGAPWVLMGLTAVEDPGLRVLPIHRLVDIPVSDRDGWMRRLKASFRVVVSRGRLVVEPTGSRLSKNAILMATRSDRSILRLPDRSGGGVGLLLSLQQMLEGYPVSFSVEPESIRSHLEDGTFSHGFLVPPLDVRDILEVVRARGILPVKSTYFFPKLFSGLIMAHTPVD